MPCTEAEHKEQRLRAGLSQAGYDSVIITRRSNFAWLTCGGEAVASRVSHTGPVFLVITPEKRYAVGYSTDLPWAMETVLEALGYEGVSLAPFGKTPEEKVLELAEGTVACDDSFLGVNEINALITRLHEPYTPQEMARYRQLARDCAEIQAELVSWISPGMTERNVLARMWQLCLERGFEGHYMFVGSDERIMHFRHLVPSDKRIEKSVLLSPGVARWGLLASTSRLIYFDNPSDDVRRRFNAMATIQATLLARTHLGTPLTSLFDLIVDSYQQLGYPEERHNHFHGGPVGYWTVYANRMQEPNEFVQSNTAFLYFLTVAGVHCEELMLVDDHGAAYVTIDPSWPMLTITVDGTHISVPDILVVR